MKNFIIGLIIGLIVGGVGVVLADTSVLYNSSNTEIGTTDNPLYIEIVN